MGVSDAKLTPWYREKVKNFRGKIALLGFTEVPSWVPKDQDYRCFDLQLGNFDINKLSDFYDNNKENRFGYDAVICTRVSYFCKDLDLLESVIYLITKPSGKIFIDTGIGDHWRYPIYKVGWVDNDGEHEKAYGNQKLHSFFYDINTTNKAFHEFAEAALNYYSEDNQDIHKIIAAEVPHLKIIFNLFSSWIIEDIDYLYLPDPRPQLYIGCTLLK